MMNLPNRKVLLPLLAGIVTAVITMIAVYTLLTRHAGPTVAQAPTELLECLVCKQPVNPATTTFRLDYHGQRIYFDRQECLDAFVAEPQKYGHLKVEVHVTPRGDASAAPSASAGEGDAGSAPVDPATPEDGVSSGVPETTPTAEITPDQAAPAPAGSASPDDNGGMVSPIPEDSMPPTDSGTSSVDANQTRDPNPPPMHVDRHHDSSSDGAAPAPAATGGDDDVPQPPSGR